MKNKELKFSEFQSIGREQRYLASNLLIHSFVWLLGPVGIHSRIRAGHVISVIKTLSLPSEACVLDAGCGRGLVLFWLAKRHPDYCLHGVDSDLGLVQQANLVAKEMVLSYPLFRVGDLTKMKLSHGQYDLICSSDVLEHIEDDVTVLCRFRFALNKTGKLILHLPLKHQEQWRFFPVFRKHVVSDHVRDEYLPKEIRSKLQSSGFEILDLSYGFGWQGELAFELNNLFWRYPILRAMLALLTFPLSLYLAYRDVNVLHPQGNSLVILAQPQT